MFDTLSNSLQKVFKTVRGYGKLSEKNVKDALREVRLALLEADVNFKVVKGFIANVREQCMGEEVMDSVSPGQQIVKRVHDELVNLLGKDHKDFDLKSKPAFIMMLGLHGAGKTTTTGKLARKWKAEGKKVLVVGCDIRRPAAVDQLRILADEAGVDLLAPEPGETVPALGRRAQTLAVEKWYDIVLFDTGGRFQIDEELVAELKDLKAEVAPRNVVLVIDAAIGQESVNVAETFNREVGLTGLILTKMDGDARGGAALSVQAVTGCPILLIGVGEKQDDLEAFHPDRMASRILGMGDVVSLVEKAESSLDADKMAGMQERFLNNSFTLEDFLEQFQAMKKLGPLENLLEMVPGLPSLSGDQKSKMAEIGGQKTRKFEAIIQSMTIRERRNPNLINASRRQRIARGSGTQTRDVNELLKQFDQTRKMSKNMKKMQNKLLRMGKRV